MRLLNRDSAECDLEQVRRMRRDVLSQTVNLSIPRPSAEREVGSHHFSDLIRGGNTNGQSFFLLP